MVIQFLLLAWADLRIVLGLDRPAPPPRPGALRMTNIEIGLISVGAMLVLIYAGMHVGVALSLLSFVGVWAMRDNLTIASNMMALAANDAISDYIFGVVPLFVLMGLFVSVADIGKDTFDVANQLCRRIAGGLGIATVAANAVFAAITGISIASAAVFTKVAVPEMLRHGYRAPFAVGVVAGSSVLGMLIPPSLLLILYGVLERAVGRRAVHRRHRAGHAARLRLCRRHLHPGQRPARADRPRRQAGRRARPAHPGRDGEPSRAGRAAGGARPGRHLWRAVHADRGRRHRRARRADPGARQAAPQLAGPVAGAGRDRPDHRGHLLPHHLGQPLFAHARHVGPDRRHGAFHRRLRPRLLWPVGALCRDRRSRSARSSIRARSC